MGFLLKIILMKDPSGYALSHSTTIAQDANDPLNWRSEYSRSSSISSASYYPSSNVDTEDEEDSVVITEYESERERTPMPFMRGAPPPPQLIQERPPPAVAMAIQAPQRRSQTQVIQPPRPASRAGYRSKTQEIYIPPRPASRASASSAYFEGQKIQRFDLSRSPSSSTMSSEVSSISPSSSKNAKKCPHCHIHSWLPHSPNCSKKN